MFYHNQFFFTQPLFPHCAFSMFLPMPLFWAAYDQQGSRWTLQAVRMNGYLTDTLHLLQRVQKFVANYLNFVVFGRFHGNLKLLITNFHQQIEIVKIAFPARPTGSFCWSILKISICWPKTTLKTSKNDQISATHTHFWTHCTRPSTHHQSDPHPYVHSSLQLRLQTSRKMYHLNNTS